MQRRQRQISFAQPLNNYVESNSREDSPSIAIQSSLELVEQHKAINASPIRNAHYRYLVNTDRKALVREHKENIYGESNQKERRIKCRKIVGYCKNIERTPLKEKGRNEGENMQGKYSNTSSIKDEKTSNPLAVKQKHPLKVSLLQNNAHHHQETEQFFPTTFNQLSQSYLNRTSNPISKISINNYCNEDNVVDEQIHKLQLQIQQLRQMKKSVTIGIKSKQSINQSLIRQSLVDSELVDSSSIRKGESTIKSFTLEGSMIKSQIVTFKEKINEEDVQMPKILKKPSKRNKDEKEAKVVQQSIHISPSIFMQTVKINDRKEQKMVFKSGDSNELRTLLSNIEAQIKLDDKLRKAKKWFQRWRNESKWSELESLLKRSRYQMNHNTIKQTFSISSEEQNPFYTPKEDDFTLNTLLLHFEQAEHYWRKNMMGNYSQQGLANDSFIEQKLDISRRGAIHMQDLVRYVNYQLDSAYRNRDVYLIYHRFKKGDVLQFKDILSVLTQTIQ